MRIRLHQNRKSLDYFQHRIKPDGPAESPLALRWSRPCQGKRTRNLYDRFSIPGRHELLLYGVELERRKADCGGDLQFVF